MIRIVLSVFLILGIVQCSNSKEDEARQRKKGEPFALLLLVQTLSYRSPYIESNTAYGISELLRLTYNSQVAGTTGSTVNSTIACSGGGTLTLTGTAVASSVSTIVDITYSMNKCKFENTYFGSSYSTIVKLTITGSIQEKGTVTSDASTTSIDLTGSALKMDGTVQNTSFSLNNIYSYSNATCDFQNIRIGNSVSGSVCGKTFAF